MQNRARGSISIVVGGRKRRGERGMGRQLCRGDHQLLRGGSCCISQIARGLRVSKSHRLRSGTMGVLWCERSRDRHDEASLISLNCEIEDMDFRLGVWDLKVEMKNLLYLRRLEPGTRQPDSPSGPATSYLDCCHVIDVNKQERLSHPSHLITPQKLYHSSVRHGYRNPDQYHCNGFPLHVCALSS